jgi:hypothetical protein
MYEHKRKPLLSTRLFLFRVAGHLLVASILILVSLLVGTVGYHWLDQLNWVDSILNASMILGGMGPVDPLHTTAAKIFASFYALYAGFILLISVGIIIAPVFHRLLHRFHMETKAQEKES